MNRRPPACYLYLLAFLGAAVPAGAQVTPPASPPPPASPTPTMAASIPSSIKSAITFSAADLSVIDAYIRGYLSAFTVPNSPVPENAARQRLLAGSTDVKADTVSAQYLLEYAKRVNTQLLPLLDNPSIHVRINAGVVAALVAGNAKNTELAPVARRLLADKCDAVVLWGMKVAAGVMSAPGQRGDLIQQVTTVVAAHQFNGPMTDEAYRALDDAFKSSTPPDAKIIPVMIQIFQARVSMYTADAFPQDASTERNPTRALTAGGAAGMWGTLTPAQQKQSIQLIVDLMTRATNLLTTKKDLSGDSRDQLVNLLKDTSGAVYAVGQNTQNVAISNAAQNGIRITVGTPIPNIASIVGAEVAALSTAFNVSAGGTGPATKPAAAVAQP